MGNKSSRIHARTSRNRNPAGWLSRLIPGSKRSRLKDDHQASSSVILDKLTLAETSTLPPSALLNLKCISSTTKSKPYVPDTRDNWDIGSPTDANDEDRTAWFKTPREYSAHQQLEERVVETIVNGTSASPTQPDSWVYVDIEDIPKVPPNTPVSNWNPSSPLEDPPKTQTSSVEFSLVSVVPTKLSTSATPNISTEQLISSPEISHETVIPIDSPAAILVNSQEEGEIPTQIRVSTEEKYEIVQTSNISQENLSKSENPDTTPVTPEENHDSDSCGSISPTPMLIPLRRMSLIVLPFTPLETTTSAPDFPIDPMDVSKHPQTSMESVAQGILLHGHTDLSGNIPPSISFRGIPRPSASCQVPDTHRASMAVMRWAKTSYSMASLAEDILSHTYTDSGQGIGQPPTTPPASRMPIVLPQSTHQGTTASTSDIPTPTMDVTRHPLTSVSMVTFPGHPAYPQPDIFLSCSYILSGSSINLSSRCMWSWIERSSVLPAQSDIGEPLSIGTFSYVYLMHFQNKEIIVKAYKKNCNIGLKAMIQEADLATHMGTYGVGPSVTGVLDQGPGAGSHLPAIAMEALPSARDLNEFMAHETSINRLDVLDIFAQAANLLSFIHERDFIHNDLKLTNILIVPRQNGAEVGSVPPPPVASSSRHDPPRGRYRAYLIDFGQTSHQQGAYLSLSAENLAELQRYPYLAPEVVNGSPTSTSSDVFSFAMAMRMATTFMPDVTLKLALAPLIARCIHTDSHRRPTMREVEDSLRRILTAPLITRPSHLDNNQDHHDSDGYFSDDSNNDGDHHSPFDGGGGGNVVQQPPPPPLPPPEREEFPPGDPQAGGNGAQVEPNMAAHPANIVNAFGEGNMMEMHLRPLFGLPVFHAPNNNQFNGNNHVEIPLRRATRNLLTWSSTAVYGDSSVHLSDVENNSGGEEQHDNHHDQVD